MVSLEKCGGHVLSVVHTGDYSRRSTIVAENVSVDEPLEHQKCIV